jgi:TM2 domain-containing membrane protein YozV
LGLGRVLAGGPYREPFTPLSADTALSAPAAADTLHTPSRAVAAVFALTLGPFGGHRLYLGTGPKVPLVYSLTFGGFGVLAVVDLAHILFTRDLSAYQKNDRIFMWAKPRKDAPTRP